MVERLAAIVSQLTQPQEPRPIAEPEKLSLPRFNPELGGADPAAWCATVSVIIEKRSLQEDELYLTINRALEGTAVQWFTHVPVHGLTWTKFRKHFLSQYDGTETAASVLIKIYNESLLKNETMGAFGNRFRSLLSATWASLTNAELINAVILNRMIAEDQSVERIALTPDVQTLDQFHKEMRVLSYACKRQAPSSNNPSAEPEAKRLKLSDHRVRCLYCGTRGHKVMECRSEKQRETRHQERI